MKGSEQMAGRTVQYNVLTTPEKLQQVNPDNVELGNDFLDYLVSVDRARSTIDAYAHDLNIFLGVSIRKMPQQIFY